jgi:hypothetical protein
MKDIKPLKEKEILKSLICITFLRNFASGEMQKISQIYDLIWYKIIILCTNSKGSFYGIS